MPNAFLCGIGIIFGLVTLNYPMAVYAEELVPSLSQEAESELVDGLLEEARLALSTKQLKKATTLFKQVLELSPNHAESLYQLAIQMFQFKDYESGFKYIQRSIELYPDKPFSRAVYAKALAEKGRFKEAVINYEEVLRVAEPRSRVFNAASLELSLLRFKDYIGKNDKKNAERMGRILVEKHASNRSVLQLVGNLFANINMLDQAQEIFLMLLSMEPKHPLYNFYLAGVYERQRRPFDAERHYEITVENTPHSRLRVDAQKKLALLRAYKNLYAGDKSTALEEFEKVLAIDSKELRALMGIAGIKYEQRKIDEAIAMYEKVIELQPRNIEAHFRLAGCYLDKGRLVEGVTILDFVAKRSVGTPRQKDVLAMLDRVEQRWDLSLLRDMAKEEIDFKVRLKANPDDVEAMIGLAKGYIKQNRKNEALEILQEAIISDPTAGQAYIELGNIYYERKDFALALENYQKALLYMVDPEILVDLRVKTKISGAFSAGKEGDNEKAEELLLAANELKKGDRAILFGLAVIGSKQADLAKSVKWYLKLIEFFPDDIGARMNLAFIYERMEEEVLATAQYRHVSMSKLATKEARKSSEQRMDYIRRQTNGVSYSVGYSLSFDDNLAGSRNRRLFEYRSDTFGSLIYKLKLRKGVKFSASLSQAYSVYHKTQSDFYSSSFTPSLLFDIGKYDLSVGVSRSESSSVLKPDQSSTITKALTSNLSWVDAISHRINFNYRGFGSAKNRFFDSESFVLGYSASRKGREKMTYSYGYSFSVVNNRHELGNDNAYVGHAFNGSVNRRFNEKLSGSIDMSLGINFYKNEDSFSGFEERRRTLKYSIGTGINYALDSWASLFANYRFSSQYSSLPIGFILSEEQAIEGRQSASLGSFTRNTLSTGVRMNF